MFSEYKNGRTPNPDIFCKREIKFDLFFFEYIWSLDRKSCFYRSITAEKEILEKLLLKNEKVNKDNIELQEKDKK